MLTETQPRFFNEEQIVPISEIADKDAYHNAILNLIRRSLAFDSQKDNRNILVKFFFGAGNKILNDYGNFDLINKRGYTYISVDDFDKNQISADFAGRMEFIFDNLRPLEIYARYKAITDQVFDSELVIYPAAERESYKRSCQFKTGCKGAAVVVSTIVDDVEHAIWDWRAFEWSKDIIDFANLKLDQHLKNQL